MTINSLPSPERVVVLACVKVVVKFALEEEVIIELPTVALVWVAERVDGVADG